MNEITLLAKSGLGWQGIGGIILLLTGIGLIYFGIKALQGYRFFPEQEHNIPEEDHYEPTQAKALQKVKTTMPDFNGCLSRGLGDVYKRQEFLPSGKSAIPLTARNIPR